MLPMKWEQLSMVKSVFQLIIKQLQSKLLNRTERWGQGSGETERERERERVCVCVRVLIETDDSVDQHPQTAWDRETHLAINDSRHLWLISEDVWDFAKMRFLAVGLLLGSDIWIDDNLRKVYLSHIIFWLFGATPFTIMTLINAHSECHLSQLCSLS